MNNKQKISHRTSATISYLISDSEEDKAVNETVIKKVYEHSMKAKKWKGYITIQKENFKIQSKDNLFKKKFKINQIVGSLSANNTRSLILIVADKFWHFFLIICKTPKDAESFVETLSKLKGSGLVESKEVSLLNIQGLSSYNFSDNTLSTTPLQQSSTFSQNSQQSSSDPKIANDYVLMAVEELSDDDDNDSNISDNNFDLQQNGWITDFTYISRDPKTGQNIACEDGPIYLFASRQLLPRPVYTSDSDCD